ncbi:MAG: hypothetical protein AAF488_01980 [Planctomycetota bacterium]
MLEPRDPRRGSSSTNPTTSIDRIRTNERIELGHRVEFLLRAVIVYGDLARAEDWVAAVDARLRSFLAHPVVQKRVASGEQRGLTRLAAVLGSLPKSLRVELVRLGALGVELREGQSLRLVRAGFLEDYTATVRDQSLRGSVCRGTDEPVGSGIECVLKGCKPCRSNAAREAQLLRSGELYALEGFHSKIRAAAHAVPDDTSELPRRAGEGERPSRGLTPKRRRVLQWHEEMQEQHPGISVKEESERLDAFCRERGLRSPAPGYDNYRKTLLRAKGVSGTTESKSRQAKASDSSAVKQGREAEACYADG